MFDRARDMRLGLRGRAADTPDGALQRRLRSVEGLRELGHTSNATRPLLWFGIPDDETAAQRPLYARFPQLRPENETARPVFGRAACDFANWTV
jgi:hypothetical protein